LVFKLLSRSSWFDVLEFSNCNWCFQEDITLRF
jgi:hypothetical protein